MRNSINKIRFIFILALAAILLAGNAYAGIDIDINGQKLLPQTPPIELGVGQHVITIIMSGGVYVTDVRASSDAQMIEDMMERYVGIVGEKQEGADKKITKKVTLPEGTPAGDFDVELEVVYNDASGVEQSDKYLIPLKVPPTNFKSKMLGFMAKTLPKDVFFEMMNKFSPKKIPKIPHELTEQDLLQLDLSEIELVRDDILRGGYTLEEIYSLEDVVQEMDSAQQNDALRSQRSRNAVNAYQRISDDQKEFQPEVKKSVKVYKITNTRNQQSAIRAKIVISLSSGPGMYDLETMEIIPKELAEDASQAHFLENAIVIEADPIVKWNFDYVPDDQEKDYAYVVDKEIESVETTTISRGNKVGWLAKLLSFLIGWGGILVVILIVGAIIYKKKKGKKGKDKKEKKKKKNNKKAEKKEEKKPAEVKKPELEKKE